MARLVNTVRFAVVAYSFLAAVAAPGSCVETGGVRAPVDSVGYALTVAQIAAVVHLGDSLEAERLASAAAMIPEGTMIGAISPHDDYLYAAPVYVHVMRRVEAPVAILIGVCHAARRQGIQGKLVFDSHRAWAGPYGDCPVSRIREEIIDALPADLVMVSDELHRGEHSLEAFIPFLQYYRPGIEIVPVLVTRMPGGLFDRASAELAGVLHRIFGERAWRLGEDVMVLISADCVHYGDDRWGGSDYAPFGVGREGYEFGVEQDRSIIEGSLTGEIGPEKVALFRERIERDDLHEPYKITWCGVYSIPFGLTVISKLAESEGRGRPVGRLLRYGTSVENDGLPLEVGGLGVTSINTLRHWVGYSAIGYW
jgi:AmmeMemoRadiSam system protein B